MMQQDGKENSQNGPAQGYRPSGKNSMLERLDRFKLPLRYEIRQVIGAGAYGQVCEAYDHEKGELVAVKRVGHMFKDLVDCKRILREVAILSRLNHDSIVQIYDIPPPSSPSSFQELYIVMEICDSDMKKLIRANVTLSTLHINTLLYNTLVGLKYLHSAGIYHRDLKPANCLVNQDCSVKICDFGLSRAIGGENIQELPDSARLPHQDGGKSSSTLLCAAKPKRHLTGHVVTRWYRAPELILLQDNYTEAIDIWSVGCIYAELLGMLEGTCFQDRSPLFPGASCFPLSPHREHKHDYKYHTQGKHDQLNMIFTLLGTPTEDEIAELSFNSDARRYIRCFAKRLGHGIRSRFPHAHQDSCDILEQMLQFNPKTRTSVEAALEHRLFYEDTLHDTPMIRERERETTARRPVELDFEQDCDLDETKLRHYFCKEIDALRRSRSLEDGTLTR
jgi:mitogen-activated protein kinase 1/3